MKNIQIEIEQPITLQGADCYLNSIANLLQHNEYSAEYCLGTNLEFHYKANSLEGRFIGRKSLHNVLKEVFDIDSFFVTDVDADQYEKNIENFLIQQMPVVVRLDIFDLEYIPGFYRKTHGITTIIIYGYNNYQRKVYFVDAWPQLHYGEMYIKDLFKSITSVNGSLLTLKFNKPFAPLNKKEFLKILDRNSHNMLSYNHPEENIKSGINGLEKFKDDIKLLADNSDNHDVLLNIFNCLITHCFHRKCFPIFLETNNKIFPNVVPEEVINNYNKLSNDWMVTRNMFIKAIKRQKISFLDRICQKLKSIIDLETQAAIQMHKIVEQ